MIFLTEQALCQNKQTIPRLDLSRVRVDRGKLLVEAVEGPITANGGNFLRYQLTKDGVSPRPIPSLEGGIHETTSVEHDEEGYTTEDPTLRKAMMEKRMKKLDTARPYLPAPVLHGDPTARVALLGFGYLTGAVLEAMETLGAEGIATKYVQLRTLWPFPGDEVALLLGDLDRLLVVEHNYTGQLTFLLPSLIAPGTPVSTIRRYDGKLFSPADVVNGVKEGR